MTEIHLNTATGLSAGFNGGAAEDGWSAALVPFVILALLGFLSGLAAVSDPLVFFDIFGRI